MLASILLAGAFLSLLPRAIRADSISREHVAILVGKLIRRTQDLQPLFRFIQYEDDLFAYGSTSRQALLYLVKKEAEFGSWKKVEQWIESPGTSLSLTDWLNFTSDLDFVGESSLDIGRMRKSIMRRLVRGDRGTQSTVSVHLPRAILSQS